VYWLRLRSSRRALGVGLRPQGTRSRALPKHFSDKQAWRRKLFLRSAGFPGGRRRPLSLCLFGALEAIGRISASYFCLDESRPGCVAVSPRGLSHRTPSGFQVQVCSTENPGPRIGFRGQDDECSRGSVPRGHVARPESADIFHPGAVEPAAGQSVLVRTPGPHRRRKIPTIPEHAHATWRPGGALPLMAPREDFDASCMWRNATERRFGRP